LKKSVELVKPGGLFFLSSISKSTEGYLLNIVLGEHVLGFLPKGTHEYELLITPETVEKILGESNLTVTNKTGVFLKPTLAFDAKRGMEMEEYPNFLKSNYMMMARN